MRRARLVAATTLLPLLALTACASGTPRVETTRTPPPGFAAPLAPGGVEDADEMMSPDEVRSVLNADCLAFEADVAAQADQLPALDSAEAYYQFADFLIGGVESDIRLYEGYFGKGGGPELEAALQGMIEVDRSQVAELRDTRALLEQGKVQEFRDGIDAFLGDDAKSAAYDAIALEAGLADCASEEGVAEAGGTSA